MTELMNMDDDHIRAKKAFRMGDFVTEREAYRKLNKKNKNSDYLMMEGTALFHIAAKEKGFVRYSKVLENVAPLFLESIKLNPNRATAWINLFELRVCQAQFEFIFTEVHRLLPSWEKRYSEYWVNSLVFLGVVCAILMGKDPDEYADMLKITERDSFRTQNVYHERTWWNGDLEYFLSRFCYTILKPKEWHRISDAIDMFHQITNQNLKAF